MERRESCVWRMGQQTRGRECEEAIDGEEEWETAAKANMQGQQKLSVGLKWRSLCQRTLASVHACTDIDIFTHIHVQPLSYKLMLISPWGCIFQCKHFVLDLKKCESKKKKKQAQVNLKDTIFSCKLSGAARWQMRHTTSRTLKPNLQPLFPAIKAWRDFRKPQVKKRTDHADRISSLLHHAKILTETFTDPHDNWSFWV